MQLFNTRRIHLAVPVFLGDKLVSLSSKKQTSTSISSTESEYIAMSGCLWTKTYGSGLITDYGFAYYRIPSCTGEATAIYSLSTAHENDIESILQGLCMKYTMADAEHAPTMAPPVRTDEQILPRIRWVPIGKSNCYLNEENLNPTQFFKIACGTFSAKKKQISSELLQARAGSYKCQLDEQWFDLTQDTLRDALQITPVDKNRAFSPPPTLDTPDHFAMIGLFQEKSKLVNVTTNEDCTNHGGHSQQSSICVLRERLQDLKDQEP
ncbi:hypothetical protein Tco_1318192 [Tanacetum coccineum]